MKKIRQISVYEISKSTVNELSNYFAINLDTYEMETVLNLSVNDISIIIECFKNNMREKYLFFEIVEEKEVQE